MNRVVVGNRPPRRRSSGFSLEEASRLRAMVIAHADRTSCPRCGAPVTPTVGGTVDGLVYLLRCQACGRGLVVHAAPGEPAVR